MEAAARRCVPTVDGPVTLKVPAATQPAPPNPNLNQNPNRTEPEP